VTDGGPYFQLPVQVNGSTDSMPASPTALTSTDTALYGITLQNGTGASIVVTLVAGGDASFIPVVFSVDPNLPINLVYPFGLLFSGGLVWSAASSGIIATVRATRKAALTLSNGVATGSI